MSAASESTGSVPIYTARLIPATEDESPVRWARPGLLLGQARRVPVIRLPRPGSSRRAERLSRWDDTRLTTHLEIRPHELTITLINLSGETVAVRDSGLLLGRRRPPRELMIGFHADSDCRAPSVGAGEAIVCARVPIELVRGLISRYKLRPSKLQARITLDDGRVIVSECLRPEHC